MKPRKRPEALVAYLEERGLSQKEFGDLVDASQGLVWQWLNGVTAISPEYAKKIEHETGIPRLQLLYPGEQAA